MHRQRTLYLFWKSFNCVIVMTRMPVRDNMVHRSSLVVPSLWSQ